MQIIASIVLVIEQNELNLFYCVDKTLLTVCRPQHLQHCRGQFLEEEKNGMNENKT